MYPRIYELDNVNFSIRENHQRALREAQADAVRQTNPLHEGSLVARVELSLGNLLIKIGERLRSRPTPHRSPVAPSAGR